MKIQEVFRLLIFYFYNIKKDTTNYNNVNCIIDSAFKYFKK